MEKEVQSYINKVVARYGKTGEINDTPDLVNLCKAWYKGFLDDFHKYTIKTGSEQETRREKKPMFMAKKSCEDFANLLLNEKCDIVIKDKKELDEILQNTNTWVKANKGIELSFALGYGAMAQSVKGIEVDGDGNIVNKNEATIVNSFVPATMMFPLSFNEGELEDVAFVFDSTNSTKCIIHIKDTRKQVPALNENGDIIANEFVTNDNYNNYDIINVEVYKNSFKEAHRELKLNNEEYTFHTMTSHPLFQVIQPNNVNNKSFDSPLGISIFANSIDTLKAIDNTYDSLDNEIELGRKRILIDTDYFTNVDENGNKIEMFDPKDAIFYQIPKMASGLGGEGDKRLVHEINGELRIESITAALNEQLNIYSSKLGMGENYYNYEMGKRIATATQVISENGQLFRTLKKHEILLEKMLKDMTISLIYLNNNFTNNPKITECNYNDITINFDDSIIEDTAAQKTNDKSEVLQGIMNAAEYRMKYYGEDEKTAYTMVLPEIIAKRYEGLQAPYESGLITPEIMVELIFKGLEKYVVGFDKDKILESLEKTKSSQTMPNPFDMFNSQEEGNDDVI